MTKEDLKDLAIGWATGFAGTSEQEYLAKAYLRLLAQEEAREQAALEGPWMCHACGHEHTGRRLAYICIGCPCPSKPETGA